MQVTGVDVDDFTRIVNVVSRLRYDRNVIIDYLNPRHLKSKPRFTTKLRTRVGGVGKTELAPGARRVGTKRMPFACWCVLRDVLHVTFENFPDAHVHSALAVYKGLDGFLSTYPHTYDGSMNHNPMHPLNDIGSQCDCDEMSPLSFKLHMVITEEPDFADLLVGAA